MKEVKNNKGWNIALWVAQVLLSLGFLMFGAMKSTQPITELSQSLPWVTQVPEGLVRFIGICELLGGLGLLLPGMLRIKPQLTQWAALGLLGMMVLAFIFHIVKGEYNVLMGSVIMGALSFFIFWGRSAKVPMLPKG